MCLILFSKNAHRNYKLIIAANRDEFYNRKTEKAVFWEEYNYVLAGKDLEGGGTWMGVSKSGRIAMLTNFRDIVNIKQQAPSRGHLVSDFLINNSSGESYISEVASKGPKYNGYNLIVGDANEMYYQSNYGNSYEKIFDGVHGLSNHLLNTPWFKVERGIKKLRDHIQIDRIVPEHLFSVLFDDIKAPKENLPDTGLPIEKEFQISSMFIKSPDYGTRCSTVVLIDNEDNLTFVERTYNISNFSFSDQKYTFKIVS